MFGCNGIFADHPVDYLIYHDDKISEAIERSGIPVKRPPSSAYGDGDWQSAGGSALAAACWLGYKPIYLVGFDGGSDTNNCYPGQYMREGRLQMPWVDNLWKIGLARVVREYPETPIWWVSPHQGWLDDVFPRLDHPDCIPDNPTQE